MNVEGGVEEGNVSMAQKSQQPSNCGDEDPLYPHGIQRVPLGISAADILRRLGDSPDVIKVSALTMPSAFVAPCSITYELDGKKRRWDAVASHPSVAVLLYHRDMHAFILVRQFRPAVYAALMREAAAAGAPSPPLTSGFTFELCAGIIDKPGLSLEDIVKEEILEEVGYDVPIDRIRKVTGFLTAVGISGARQTIFAAEIDEGMLPASLQRQDGDSLLASDAGHGGGVSDHGEAIEVVALPIDKVDDFVMDEGIPKSSGAMFALSWGARQLFQNSGRLFTL